MEPILGGSVNHLDLSRWRRLDLVASADVWNRFLVVLSVNWTCLDGDVWILLLVLTFGTDSWWFCQLLESVGSTLRGVWIIVVEMDCFLYELSF